MNSSTLLQALSVLSVLYFVSSIYSLMVFIYSHGTNHTSSIQRFLCELSDAFFLFLVTRMMKSPAAVEALNLYLFCLITVVQTIKICFDRSTVAWAGAWAYIVINLASSLFAVYNHTYSTEIRIKTEMKKKEENVDLHEPLLKQKDSEYDVEDEKV
eukprot:CAMPEP_0178968144 /NCGR_PEP_ID=MMETSP0789-20121207/18037_1 /TAXON_ID=3005 /ORGANISM="Rhizosolenia setigera, Strain CCMP 1694" /LENGTH=155 /DNA_ID=CAMNT_0020653933 /DNA_START=29 /DNA_END=496 /DNA_ORIENTATION=-